MGFKTVTHSDTYFEDATHGSFPLPFSGDFYQERLHVSKDGLTAVLGVLCADNIGAEDPFDMSEEGDFCQFSARENHYKERPTHEEWKRIIRANPGRVFTHNGTGDCHGPGTVHCYVSEGPFTVADTKDVRRGRHRLQSPAADAIDDAGGYYIVPEDATDPAQYAKGMLESYSAWCNGEVYGVMVWIFTRETTEDAWELDEESRDSECWGYIGGEYAEQELKEQFDAACAA